MTNYEIAQKLLKEGLPVGSDIKSLQVALKLLGFMPNNYLKQVDGKLGKSTLMATKALNWAVFEREDEGVPYDKITDLLLNKNVDWFKVPFVENPQEENKLTISLLESKKDFIIDNYEVPFDFLKALLWQETNLSHYDPDGFVFVGCDFGKEDSYKYRSRGWGLGQYTITNHPPDKGQQQNIIIPIKNLEFVINHLKGKFDLYAKRDFVKCRYRNTDKYLRDCIKCVENSANVDIKLPDAQYHPKAQIGYKDMPMLNACGWGLAVERYNGAGPNAVAYKYEVLMKILGREIR